MQVLELKVKQTSKELNPEGRCTQRLKADEKLSLKWVLILSRMVKAKSTWAMGSGLKPTNINVIWGKLYNVSWWKHQHYNSDFIKIPFPGHSSSDSLLNYSSSQREGKKRKGNKCFKSELHPHDVYLPPSHIFHLTFQMSQQNKSLECQDFLNLVLNKTNLISHSREIWLRWTQLREPHVLTLCPKFLLQPMTRKQQ